MKRPRLIPVLLAVALLAAPVTGRDQGASASDLFQTAVRLARTGKRAEARDVCRSILERKPGHHDARTLLGRLYLWDGDYEAARREFRRVLDADPGLSDTRRALIDAETWSGRLDEALFQCREGLDLDPSDTGILLRQTRLLLKREEIPAAASSARRLLGVDPAHREGLRLMERIQNATEIFSLTQRYRFDGFMREGSDFRPWHQGSIEGAVKGRMGSLILRLHYAGRRYGEGVKTGTQFELDAWPRFGEGVYGYLNAGGSRDSLFPELRLGGELYLNLPAGFELSGGMRYLDFVSTRVRIYTGSVGKYHRNLWISLRPFFTPKSTGHSFSILVQIRRYSGSRDNYTGLTAGYGSSPAEVIDIQDIQRFNSLKLGVEFKRELSSALAVRGILRFEREEILRDVFGDRLTISLSLEERFYRKY